MPATPAFSHDVGVEEDFALRTFWLPVLSLLAPIALASVAQAGEAVPAAPHAATPPAASATPPALAPAATAPPLVVAEPVVEPAQVAEPPPGPRRAPSRPQVATTPRPRPPPPAPPPRARRWYGWQVLIAHGLTDTLLTSALMIAEADEDAALGLVIAGIAARPIGSFAVELAHNGEYILAPIGSLMLPVMAAGGAVGVAEGIGVSDDKPAIVRALAGGLMVGGSVMAALEASFAFEDAEPLRVSAGPGGVTLAGAF